MVAVTSAYRHKESPQRGRETWNASDGFVSSEYTRTYQAVTSAATTDEMVILGSSYVPQMFETDPFNPDARVIGRDASRTQSPTVWQVEVTYSTAAPTQQQGDTNGTPLGKPVEWESSFEPIQVVMDRDVNGDPVILSNGLRPNPPLMVTRYMPVYRATVALPNYPSSWMASYAGRVNSDTYLGCAAGTLMCRIPSIKPKDSNGIHYYLATVEFMYDPRGWQPRLLNAGYMEFDDDPGLRLQHIKDSDGQDVTEPWPLDANGKALSQSAVNSGTGFTFTSVTAYESASLSSMGLGTP